jgi:hypothetical protein
MEDPSDKKVLPSSQEVAILWCRKRIAAGLTESFHEVSGAINTGAIQKTSTPNFR